MISREDILHELELLPVWQLRTPAPAVTVETKLVAIEGAAALAPEQGKGASEVVQTIEPPQSTHQFRLIMSDNTQWAFLLQSQQSKEAEVLLKNMLKAVSVNVSHDTADASIEHLHQQTPKVIVAMGETEVQKLLNKEQTLGQLRGKTHQYQGIPVIATYSPTYLLMHLQDKAKAWEDLCLAKFTIASL